MIVVPWLNDIQLKLREALTSLASVELETKAIYDAGESVQSGSVTMDGTEQTLYERASTDSRPIIFDGGFIDLSSLQAGDTVVVKTYVKVKSGGSYRRMFSLSLQGVQTDSDIEIGRYSMVHGLKITAQQTAGTNRTVDCDFIDAAAGGV